MLTIAGRGNLGRSLARALGAKLVPARSGFRMPERGVLFLAVPDGAVRETAARIAAMDPPAGLAVVHLSGALGLDALAPLRGRPLGSFHPLQSFPAPREPGAFRGITIGVDATSPALLRRLRALARSLGARPKVVGDEERAVYHAAAVFASNFVDVVVAEAVRMLEGIGWSEKESLDALMPLVQGAVDNIGRRGPVGALTGPIRRGDAETVRRHIDAIQKLDRPIPAFGRTSPQAGKSHLPMNGEDLYRILGLVALEIAQQAGLEPAAAERTRRALTRNVAATRRRGHR